MRAPRSSCAEGLKTLVVDGDLGAGLELPSDCTLADALAVFGPGGTEGSGTLKRATHRWLKFDVPGSQAQVRVWHDDGRVLMVDVTHPTVRQTPDTLRRALGEPAEVMEARLGPTHEEWLYPARGLTLAVGNGLDDASDAPPHVSWFAAYPPTTLDDYVQRLGGKDPWVTRRPLPR